MDELICYLIVNNELGMSPGKIVAQTCHVMTEITMDYCSDPESKPYKEFKLWYNQYSQKKIVLRGKQKDLEKLVDQGFYYIRDIGLTEVPENSLTCVGLGIMRKSEAQQYIKRLQLL